MDIRWTFYFEKACRLAHPETRLTGVSPSGCWRYAGYTKKREPIILIQASLWRPSEYGRGLECTAVEVIGWSEPV